MYPQGERQITSLSEWSHLLISVKNLIVLCQGQYSDNTVKLDKWFLIKLHPHSGHGARVSKYHFEILYIRQKDSYRVMRCCTFNDIFYNFLIEIMRIPLYQDTKSIYSTLAELLFVTYSKSLLNRLQDANARIIFCNLEVKKECLESILCS